MFELTQTADLSHWQGDETDGGWLGFLDDVRRFTEGQPLRQANPCQPGKPVARPLPPTSHQSPFCPSPTTAARRNRLICPTASVKTSSPTWARSRRCGWRHATPCSPTRTGTWMCGTPPVSSGSAMCLREACAAPAIGCASRHSSSTAATGGQVWAERYDRSLSDIFALQDEISQAIVKALKLKLLPEEKQAIERRGTSNSQAYELYLMARQYYITGNERHDELIARLCRRAIEIDPSYPHAWALLAYAQRSLHHRGLSSDDGGEAADRAIALAPGSAGSPCHARRCAAFARPARTGGCGTPKRRCNWIRNPTKPTERRVSPIRVRGASTTPSRSLEKAASLMDNDFQAASQVVQCYQGIGDEAGALEACSPCLRAHRTTVRDRARTWNRDGSWRRESSPSWASASGRANTLHARCCWIRATPTSSRTSSARWC